MVAESHGLKKIGKSRWATHWDLNFISCGLSGYTAQTDGAQDGRDDGTSNSAEI
jgi:putative N-acetylmannosamine-6-phosphate epimerase